MHWRIEPDIYQLWILTVQCVNFTDPGLPNTIMTWMRIGNVDPYTTSNCDFNMNSLFELLPFNALHWCCRRQAQSWKRESGRVSNIGLWQLLLLILNHYDSAHVLTTKLKFFESCWISTIIELNAFRMFSPIWQNLPRIRKDDEAGKGGLTRLTKTWLDTRLVGYTLWSRTGFASVIVEHTADERSWAMTQSRRLRRFDD